LVKSAIRSKRAKFRSSLLLDYTALGHQVLTVYSIHNLKPESCLIDRHYRVQLFFIHHTSYSILSRFTWSKQKWLFWRAGFYSDRLLFYQSNLKSFQKSLIGWKKAGPPKKNTFVLIM